MDRMVDYILWMRDFRISATGFQDVDALVLCMLSYFDLSPLFSAGRETATLRDAQRLIDEGRVKVNIIGRDMGYQDILQAAIRSKRFGELTLSHYVDHRRQDPPLQFAAVTFTDSDGFSFIAYRGTDSSLAGWREDFMISFAHTQAQEMARKYAEEVMATGDMWIMGGHSKGGNLALYAACTMDRDILRRLDRFYMLDSPGLCPEVMDLDCMTPIESKGVHIIPEFSIVGKLFTPMLSDTRIVRASVNGFYQHSLATWGVDHGRLYRVAENTTVSRWIGEIVDGWIHGLSRENRLIFFSEIFDALSAGGARSFEDLDRLGFKGLEAIARRLQQTSDITRRALADLPRRVILGSLDAMHHGWPEEMEM